MAAIRSTALKIPSCRRCWLPTTRGRLHVRLASSLVVAEHDGGKLKDSSLSAIAAAGGLGESSTVSVLLGGTGPALQQAASSASKAHPSITKPGAFLNGWAQSNGSTLKPKFVFPRSKGVGQALPIERSVFSCKAVIESGSSPAGTTSDDKTPDPTKAEGQLEDGSLLTGDGSELRSTVRLVECAMLAATAGLAYFLSNLLRIEAYFGCFFPLPVVISSMRWGPAAGRKTMVATAMLLLILSGPLKAASYLLMHGFVGLAMGTFWKWNLNWALSIAACTVVRCLGALGFVLMTSWLLRDNLLALITMNAHASLSYMLAALGINLVPTMPMIYVVFASLLVVNCGSFVFLLHVLYAIFLRRLGLRGSITVPGWVERAI